MSFLGASVPLGRACSVPKAKIYNTEQQVEAMTRCSSTPCQRTRKGCGHSLRRFRTFLGQRLTSAAVLLVAALGTGFAALAKTAHDMGGLDFVYPPSGHVFRHDEEVQLALLFGVESAEVVCVPRVHAYPKFYMRFLICSHFLAANAQRGRCDSDVVCQYRNSSRCLAPKRRLSLKSTGTGAARSHSPPILQSRFLPSVKAHT